MLRRRDNVITGWNNDRPRQAYELALMGATDEDVARVMGLNINTINLWKRTRPEFLERLNAGKEIADASVANALYKRAVGFTVTEIDVKMYRGEIIQTPVRKYYPPDAWAAHKWLTVRQRPKWGDVTKIENTQTNININKLDFTGLSMEDLMFMKRIGMTQLQKQLNEHIQDGDNN